MSEDRIIFYSPIFRIAVDDAITSLTKAYLPKTDKNTLSQFIRFITEITGVNPDERDKLVKLQYYIGRCGLFIDKRTRMWMVRNFTEMKKYLDVDIGHGQIDKRSTFISFVYAGKIHPALEKAIRSTDVHKYYIGKNSIVVFGEAEFDRFKERFTESWNEESIAKYYSSGQVLSIISHYRQYMPTYEPL
jgi:hypothetical protein